MSPLRLWHLMILTVYVAVGLAAFRYGDHLYRLGDTKHAFQFVLLVPWIFALVSACILPASPQRDWLVSLLLSIGALPYLLSLLLMPLVVFAVAIAKGPTQGLIPLLVYPLILMLPLQVLMSARDRVALHLCPGCGRRRLVRSILERPHGRSMKRYCQCAVCDAQHLLAEHGSACPGCGRATMMPRPYVFWWCSCCKARYRRLWRRGWEDASGPEDDRFYWLWDPLQSLRRLRSIGRQDYDS